MTGFYKYETVSLPLKFTPAGILDGYKHIIVSIKQKGVIQIDKNENDLTIDVGTNTIIFSLSQEETGQFIPAEAYIQVNIYYDDDERDVSTQSVITVYDNLYKKVINDE